MRTSHGASTGSRNKWCHSAHSSSSGTEPWKRLCAHPPTAHTAAAAVKEEGRWPWVWAWDVRSDPRGVVRRRGVLAGVRMDGGGQRWRW